MDRQLKEILAQIERRQKLIADSTEPGAIDYSTPEGIQRYKKLQLMSRRLSVASRALRGRPIPNGLLDRNTN